MQMKVSVRMEHILVGFYNLDNQDELGNDT
jgi:hypothetical protein